MKHLRSTLIITGGIALTATLPAAGTIRTGAAPDAKLILSGQRLSYPVLAAGSQAAWSRRGLSFEPASLARSSPRLTRQTPSTPIAGRKGAAHPQDRRQKLPAARMGSVKAAVEARKTGAPLQTILFTPIVPVPASAATP